MIRRALYPDRALYPQRAIACDRVVKAAPARGPDYSELWPYQKVGVDFLRSHPHALLADDMSLGKSCQFLRALGSRPRVIVAGPASSVITWREQVRRWRPDLHFTENDVLRKPGVGEVLFQSIDGLPEPVKGSQKLVLEPMRDVDLGIDEVHLVRNWRAQRTQKIRLLGRQCGTVRGLTGTPMPGKPEDLWGLLGTLCLAWKIFPGGWDEFVELCSGKKRYIRDKKTGGLRQIGYQWGNISPEVRERLSEVMLRRLRADVHENLPREQYVDVTVPVSAEGIALLDEAKKRWDELGLDPHDLPPFEMMSEARAALARSRIAAAVEWADTCSRGTPLLVFSAHEEPILAMRELEGAGAFVGETPIRERSRLVEKFKAGELRILAMTIQTGGTSLNLEEAGACLFVDRAYTPGDNDQAKARFLRPGQKHPSVLIARMRSEHPLDVRLQEILDEKEPRIAAMVGA